MRNLDRWMPFKFRRKGPDDHKTERKAPDAMQRGTEDSPMWGAHMPALMEFFNEPFFRDPFAQMGRLDDWFGDFSPRRFQPTVDVVDEEEAVRVSAELPGLKKEEVKLELDNHVLTIRGEKKNEEERKENGAFRTERYYGYFQRAIPLPGQDLDEDNAVATFADGVLNVRFPKRPGKSTEGKEIPVG